MTQRIHTTLVEKHTLICPCCEQSLLLIYADHSEVPGGGYWLRDGDTIPGLYNQLTETQITPSAFADMLMVGSCRHCGNDYYVIQASFMNANFDDVEAYIHFNTDLGSEHNYVCSPVTSIENVPNTWLMQEYNTPHGLMQHHTFGPWNLDDLVGVIGPYGVSSCCASADADSWYHGRRLLVTLWDDLRSMHPEIV